MGKILFWAILILVALIAVRIAATRKAAQRTPTDHQRGDSPAEAMVRCAHCGVHLPRSEALLINGQLWCSQEHARLGEAQ